MGIALTCLDIFYFLINEVYAYALNPV